MIISHKYKFIFIKTRKTAGTSTEKFLSQHLGEGDTWSGVMGGKGRNHKGHFNPLNDLKFIIHDADMKYRPGSTPKKLWNIILRLRSCLRATFKRKKWRRHMPAVLVKARLPANIWDSYFKFCVERNPWDKTISHYYFVSRRLNLPLSLDEYLSKGYFASDYKRYIGYEGAPLVDKVVRYEKLMEELGDIFRELGIPFEGSLGAREHSEYRGDRRPYQEVYTDEQRKIVERAFAREIKMFNYDF